MTGKRKPLYLSSSRDKDILDYIEPILKQEQYSFSFIVRELIRDGIKYRNCDYRSPNPNSNSNSNLDGTQVPMVLQSITQRQVPTIQKIELKKQEISDKDIEARLDNF